MPRKTDGILFELQPRPTNGDDCKPLLYAQPVVERKYDLDAIDDFCAKYRHTSKGEMKHFFGLLEEVTTMWLRLGFRKKTGCVGNSQIHDPKVMDEALRQSTVMQHVTIQRFMFNSGLKYQSAKRYLDSLCEGDSPRLQRYKEGRMWHYRVLTVTTSSKK